MLESKISVPRNLSLLSEFVSRTLTPSSPFSEPFANITRLPLPFHFPNINSVLSSLLPPVPNDTSHPTQSLTALGLPFSLTINRACNLITITSSWRTLCFICGSYCARRLGRGLIWWRRWWRAGIDVFSIYVLCLGNECASSVTTTGVSLFETEQLDLLVEEVNQVNHLEWCSYRCVV